MLDSDEQPLSGCLDPWKVYAWCSEENSESCELLSRMSDMEEIDAKSVLRGLVKLLKYSCLGKSLQELYDEKQCHEAFSFVTSQGRTEKVYRIWPNGDVRIYFSYGNNKSLIIFYSLTKRKDKLSDEEENELEEVCKAFLNAQANNQLNYVELS